MASPFDLEGQQKHAATISWWQSRRASTSSVCCCLRRKCQKRYSQFIHTKLSITTIQDQHVWHQQECDGLSTGLDAVTCSHEYAEQAAGNTSPAKSQADVSAKLMCQLCLQTHSHTHLNPTTQTPISGVANSQPQHIRGIQESQKSIFSSIFEVRDRLFS